MAHPAMPGDLEPLPLRVMPTVPATGPRPWRPSSSAGCGRSSRRSASWGSGTRSWCRRGWPGCGRRGPAAPTPGV